MSQAAKRELERQRQLEWERNRRQELLNQRNKEQEDIVVLKAKKKTLEFELEALVSSLIVLWEPTCIELLNANDSYYFSLVKE
jgi:hypothetical protein